VVARIKQALFAIAGFTLIPLLGYLGYRREHLSDDVLETSHFYRDTTPFDDLVAIHRGYLSSSGWLESKRVNRSVAHGKLVPWITFPALHFLESLDLSDTTVLEIGSGASTHWLVERAAGVISYEFDTAYFEHNLRHLSRDNLTQKNGVNGVGFSDSRQRTDLPANLVDVFTVDVAHAQEFESPLNFMDLPRFLAEVITDTQAADLIFIDGGPRNLMAALASIYARPSALIVVDNTDMAYLRTGRTFLLDAGYAEIAFHGIAPLNPHASQTSIFFKDAGVLQSLSRRE
jgi:hypothetical protein